MDLKTAVKAYQFAERAKSELIIISRLAIALTGFTGSERAGGKRMLIMLMESVRSELEFAANATGENGFRSAISHLNEAIGLTESMDTEGASEKIGLSVSEYTTIAARAWEVLSGQDLL